MLGSSQYSQDIFAKTFAPKSAKFFIEIGGYDPFLHSNSFWLESKCGWSGICVEPDPIKAQKIQDNRSAIVINKAISSKDAVLEFVVAGALSAVKDTLPKAHFCRIQEEFPNWKIIPVESTPFNRLSEHIPSQNKEIGYVSIDVEGHELSVLQGIDFSVFKIATMTVECGVSNGDEITSILNNANFHLMFKYHADSFFVHESIFVNMTTFQLRTKKIKMRLAFLLNDMRLIKNRLLNVFRKT